MGGLAQDPYWIRTPQAGIRKLQLVHLILVFPKQVIHVHHKWM